MLRFFPAIVVFAAAAAGPVLTPAQRAEDFDAAWRAIDERYAYFERDRAAWRGVRDAWRPRAVRAQSPEAFAVALEGALQQLHDDHVELSEPTPASQRRVPAEADIWASWRQEGAVIEAVRTYGDADVAGLTAGARVVSIEGKPVEQAVRERLRPQRAPGAGDRDWALRHALAGPRVGTLNLEVLESGRMRTVQIEHAPAKAHNGPPLIARRMGETRDLGYIRIKQGWGETRLAGQFDGALTFLSRTRALILDLRELSSGGSREVTLAILGRFAAAPATWQLRESPRGERIADKVSPRGLPYRAPVVVLVDRWTAGEAEALAAGLSAIAKARLVGTRMAGLRGELEAVSLPHSGLVVRFPAQKALHANGTPREQLRPDVEVDLAAPSGGPGDPILYQALKLLEPPSASPAR